MAQPAEMPVPLSWYIDEGYASRTQFWRWRRQGLRILHVGGKRFIRPSDLAAFLAERDKAEQTEP